MTHSLMLLGFLRWSNMSKGARRGTKRIDLNSSWPSTEKCCVLVVEGGWGEEQGQLYDLLTKQEPQLSGHQSTQVHWLFPAARLSTIHAHALDQTFSQTPSKQ
jgi:hypothetical protein